MSSRKSSRRSSVRKSNNNQGIDMDNIQKEIDKNIAKRPNTSIGSRIPSFIFTLSITWSYSILPIQSRRCRL